MNASTYDVALVADQIRLLVYHNPDAILYKPGKPLWGLHRMPDPKHFLLNLDDLTRIVIAMNPGMIPIDDTTPAAVQGDGMEDATAPALTIEAPRLVRALAECMPIIQRPGHEVHRVEVGGRIYQHCCLANLEDLPWIAYNAPMAEAGSDGVIVIPSLDMEVDDLIRDVINPNWMAWNHVRLAHPPFADENQFLDSLAIPKWRREWQEARYVDHLRIWWQTCRRTERSRCGLMGHLVPAWLQAGDDRKHDDLLIGEWIAANRAEHESEQAAIMEDGGMPMDASDRGEQGGSRPVSPMRRPPQVVVQVPTAAEPSAPRPVEGNPDSKSGS